MPASQIWNLGSRLRIVKTFHFQMQKMLLPEKGTFKRITDQCGCAHKICLHSVVPQTQLSWSEDIETYAGRGSSQSKDGQAGEDPRRTSHWWQVVMYGIPHQQSSAQWIRRKLNSGRLELSFKKKILVLRQVKVVHPWPVSKIQGLGRWLSSSAVKSSCYSYREPSLVPSTHVR